MAFDKPFRPQRWCCAASWLGAMFSLALIAAEPGYANPIDDFGTPPPGPFGIVNLDLMGMVLGGLDVTITLNSGEEFATLGVGGALLWDQPEQMIIATVVGDSVDFGLHSPGPAQFSCARRPDLMVPCSGDLHEVPEPSSLTLLSAALLGFGSICFWQRRRFGIDALSTKEAFEQHVYA
jgi:hypothetical protein